MTAKQQRILVLAPHTDDAEFGCGGTMSRFVEEGCEVHQVAFSAAEGAVPDEFERTILREEIRQACQTLDVPLSNLQVLAYPVRQFPLHRQNILDDMIRLGKEIEPNLVLLPSPNDTHQDHQTIAQEGFRAFKTKTLLGYEMPWNNLSFQTSAFVFLEERHVEKKVAALKCYESQKGRHYATEDFIRGLARTRGVQIGCRYAEVFEAIRWVIP